MFSSQSRASVMQIRMHLDNLQKKDMSTTDYFRKVKSLADTMAFISRPLEDEEAVCHMLASHGSEYDSLVTSMTTHADPVTLTDLYVHLISNDLRVEHNNSMQVHSSANNVTRNQQQNTYTPPKNYGHGHGRGGGGGRGSNNNGRPFCQVCGKPGHEALCCYHRFDQSYQVNEPQSVDTATTNYTVDTNWYADSGATDPITSYLSRLSMKEHYKGTDQVQVVNG